MSFLFACVNLGSGPSTSNGDRDNVYNMATDDATCSGCFDR